MAALVDLGRNCTNAYMAQAEVHNTIQTIALSASLAFIFGINAIVIGLTIGTQELNSCCFNLQLMVGYMANILAAFSLFGNDLWFSAEGIIPPGCEPGKDSYFCLYFGISINMEIVVLNTHYRYRRIVSMSSKRKCTTIGLDNGVLFKAWLPALLISLFVSLLASFMQKYFLKYQFFACVGISFIPLVIAIAWNISLSKFLESKKKNAVVVDRPESMRMLERAKFIINAIISAHVVILTIGSGATLFSGLYFDDELIVVIMIWLLRVAYLILFTVDSVVFLYKTPLARNMIKAKVAKLIYFVCKRGEAAEQNERRSYVMHDRTSTSTSTKQSGVSTEKLPKV